MNTFVFYHGSGRAGTPQMIGQAASVVEVLKEIRVTETYPAKSQTARKEVAISERERALTIRAAWMRQMGLAEEEIKEASEDKSSPIDLDHEIRNLWAAERLAQITPSRSELHDWAIKY